MLAAREEVERLTISKCVAAAVVPFAIPVH